MALEGRLDGLYRIHNTTTGEVLDLAEGNWEYGQVCSSYR